MTHRASIHDITGKALAAVAAAMLMAVGSAACSGSPLENAPFAPTAVPTVTLSAETGDAEAAFGTLGGPKDKGKGGSDSGTGTESDSGKGKDSDSGKGKDGDSGKGKTEETIIATSVIEAAGAVVTATGTCPATTFTVGTQSFTTDAATTYEGGVCADIVATAHVDVQATGQADGTLLATRVSFEEADEAENDDEEGEEDAEGDLHGTVSSFRGVCPAVNFNLRSIRVSTTEETTFVDGTCEDLRPNVKVLVTGTAGETRRTLVADTITIVRTH